MATINNVSVPKSNKISTKFVLGIAGWVIIATVLVAGAGFYFGYSTRPRRTPRPAPLSKTRSRPHNRRQPLLKRPQKTRGQYSRR
jgi:hypothetical protein